MKKRKEHDFEHDLEKSLQSGQDRGVGPGNETFLEESETTNTISDTRKEGDLPHVWNGPVHKQR